MKNKSIIYFGHGNSGDWECLSDNILGKKTNISFNDIIEITETYKHGNVLVISDCCYSD
jgi:hypothetical protein